MRALFAAALLALAGCEITPSYVESVDIDDAMARNHFKTVCKGLEMKDDDTRRYATTKLKEITDPISQECVCQFVGQGKHGWDDAIADGLTGTDRDDPRRDFAQCEYAMRVPAHLAFLQIRTEGHRPKRHPENDRR